MKRLNCPSPAMVVAMIALVVAMAGTGYAASKISGSSIKKNTVPGNRIKKNSLGGTQINESKLGKVPKAAQADNATNATNANALGGKALAAVLPTSGSAQNADTATLAGFPGTDVVTGTITTTAPSRILIDGTVELQGADADERAQCAIRLDGTQISLSYETTFDDIGADNEATVAVDAAGNNVAAGAHTVVLLCQALSGTVVKDDAAINVVGIPVP